VRSFRGSSPDSAPGTPRLHGAPRARAIDGSELGADRPLISPSGDLTDEARVAGRGDDQVAVRVGGVGPPVAGGADRHQPVEIEVRARLDGPGSHNPAHRPSLAFPLRPVKTQPA